MIHLDKGLLVLIDQSSTIITTISHLIQLSVAPVFLLAGVAGLLNVFIGRLTRIIDKLERIDNNKHLEENEKLLHRRRFLVMRMENTNLAIFFCTATGLMVALVILLIFSSALLSFNASTFIAILFVIAMASLIIALLLFLREIYYTTHYIRVKKHKKLT